MPEQGRHRPFMRPAVVRRGSLAAFLAAVAAATIALAGCGSSAPSAAAPRQDPAPTILAGPVESTTFAQARTAVLALYRSHPTVKTFTYKDVDYTAATRNKVLAVCHRGGPEKSARSLESTRVLACAPLIFFYYSYGRQASVADAVNAARKLYWYAVTSNRAPFPAGPGLERLLLSWGVA
jgi:hypothetical protein